MPITKKLGKYGKYLPSSMIEIWQEFNIFYHIISKYLSNLPSFAKHLSNLPSFAKHLSNLPSFYQVLIILSHSIPRTYQILLSYL